jgi:Serine carboxypeptidase S28
MNLVPILLLAVAGISKAQSYESAPVGRLTTRNENGLEINSTTKISHEMINLPLDHWNSSAGTFLNHFFVYEEAYRPGGPVFIFDAGEGSVLDEIDTLNEKNSTYKQILQRFNGMGIIWEHRYYGQSTPNTFKPFTNRKSSNNNAWPPAEHYRYLTAEQALADIPAFAWNFSRKGFLNQDLTPASTPWVFIGGSYPGMRAAFARNVYPETIFASYAASAPVQTSVDMSFYWDPMWQMMKSDGYANCSNDIHSAILAMDKMMEDPVQAQNLKVMFSGHEAANATNEDFAFSLAIGLGYWQGDGIKGGLDQLCDRISTDPITGKTSNDLGWAHVKGVNFTIHRWATYDSYDVEHNITRLRISSKSDQMSLDSRSWGWQVCTEMGFFQTANLGEHQLVSKFNSLKYQIKWCHDQFADGYKSGLVPEQPRVEETNAQFGGWNIRPTNTFWTVGQFDPWTTLSMLSSLETAPKLTAVQSIPECSEELPNSEIFGMVIPAQGHVSDFSSDAGAVAVELFNRALEKWLSCRKKSGNGEYKGNTTVRRVNYHRQERFGQKQS